MIKMTFTNTLEKIIGGALCLTTLVAKPAIAEEKTLPKSEYTLELGVTNDHAVRNRLWVNNVRFNLGKLKLAYESFNEAENGDSDTLYGWHRITIGSGKDIKGVFGFTTDKSGITQTLIGVRDTSLIERLKGYGFLEVLGNREGSQFAIFYGRSLDKKTTLELFHETYKAFGGETGHYSELQVKHGRFFVRGEVVDMDLRDVRYVLGYSFKFK